MRSGNLSRRRLLVGHAHEGETVPGSSMYGGPDADMGAIQLAGAAPAAPQTDFSDGDVDFLARLIFAEAANHMREPGAYQAVGSTVLNRVKARGFPKTLQGVILGRTAGGVPQFAGTQNKLWRDAANPAGLTGDNAPPPPGSDHPPPGRFFTDGINSGRLRETYRAGQFRFLRDTQP